MASTVPPGLTNKKLPLEARLEVLATWLDSDDEDAAVDAYIGVFLEHLVGSGKPQLAHEAGLRAAGGQKVRLPRTLLGAEGLDAQPYAWRGAIEVVLGAAAVRAASRPALLPPLFRSLLLWATYERELAMVALQAARPSDAEIVRGLSAVCSALREVKDNPGDRLVTVLKAGQIEPRWVVGLCQALARETDGIRALRRLPYAILPEPSELCPAPWAGRAADVAALQAQAGSGLAVVPALAALTLAAAPGALGDDALVRLLDGRDPGWIQEWVCDWLIFRDVRQPALGPLTATLLAGAPRASLAEKLTLLHQNAAPPPAREALRGDGLLLLPVDGQVVAGPALVDGRAWLLVRRVLRRFPDQDWRCSDDELSVAVLDPEGGLRWMPAPIQHPSRRTGAAGAQRVWELVGVRQGHLVVALRVPFSDQRGWGTENHVFAVDTSDGGFYALARGEGAHPAHALTAPTHEDALPSWGYGELVCWFDAAGVLQAPNDGTPYHLDGVDPGDEDLAARAAARASDRGWADAEVSVAGLPLADPHLLGGVAFPEGRVAVAVRSFVRAPVFQALDWVGWVRR